MAQPSQEDFNRLENKLDKLTDAVLRLVLLEERQSAQGERIGAAEQRIAVNESTLSQVHSKVERWINRGIGAWAVAVVLFAIVQFGAKVISK
tara:strand:- start:493 stop:768 length:276 start_codon:yes stop_codon:yes gene_type:complete